jgi:cytidyltransferase-like protein
MQSKDRIIITCGTFDPLTHDELLYLKKCHLRGEWLVVGVHSDWWMKWAEGGYVQNYETRREIIKSLKYVDEIFTFNDNDGTITQLLKLTKICYPNANITYISDAGLNNLPEVKFRGINYETLE